MGEALIEPTAAQLEEFRARVARKTLADAEVKCNPRHQPGDPVAMRGIPLVGGVGGVIAGTRPGDSVARLLHDDAFIRRRPPKASRPALPAPASS